MELNTRKYKKIKKKKIRKVSPLISDDIFVKKWTQAHMNIWIIIIIIIRERKVVEIEYI